MTDDQAPYDWRPLWSIFCALNSAEHPLYLAFLLPDHREKAIVNAVRSNKVAVRGRRGGGYSSLVTGGVPEEIKGLNKDADVNVLQNECQFASNRDPFSRPIPTPPERIDLTT